MVRKIDVRLHEDYYNVLTQFGTLNQVVDKAINAIEAGSIDLDCIPACPPLTGTHKYIVTVDNLFYDDLVQIYGSHSNRISMRRILYYIVDSELYNTLRWEPVQSVSPASKRSKRIDNLLYEMAKVINSETDKDRLKILLHAYTIIQQLK
jgi:hypothetical protein